MSDKPKEEQTSGEAAQASTSTLSGEDLDRRIDAVVQSRLHAADVERDLQALVEKVPPAVPNNAENRALLLDAKTKGPERYKAALALIAGNAASALLGGPIAGAEQAGAARAGLGVNSKELAALNALGFKAEDVASLEQKYDLRRVN